METAGGRVRAEVEVKEDGNLTSVLELQLRQRGRDGHRCVGQGVLRQYQVVTKKAVEDEVKSGALLRALAASKVTKHQGLSQRPRLELAQAGHLRADDIALWIKGKQKGKSKGKGHVSGELVVKFDSECSVRGKYGQREADCWYKGQPATPIAKSKARSSSKSTGKGKGDRKGKRARGKPKLNTLLW